MADRIDFRVLGLGPLAALFTRIRAKDVWGAAAFAMERVASRIERDVRQRVPRETGNLRNAMGRKVLVRFAKKDVMGVIGPRRSARFIRRGYRDARIKQFATRYAHLVEFGTHGGGSMPPGPRPAQPFMRPALAAARRYAALQFSRDFWREVHARARRP